MRIMRFPKQQNTQLLRPYNTSCPCLILTYTSLLSLILVSSLLLLPQSFAYKNTADNNDEGAAPPGRDSGTSTVIKSSLDFRIELTSRLPSPPIVELTTAKSHRRDNCSVESDSFLASLPTTPVVLQGLLFPPSSKPQQHEQIRNSSQPTSMLQSLERALALIDKLDEGFTIPVDLAPHQTTIHSNPSSNHTYYPRRIPQQKVILPSTPSPSVILSPAKISFRPSQVFDLIRMGRSTRTTNNNNDGKKTRRLSSYYAYVRTWNILSHLFPSSVTANNNTANNNNNNDQIMQQLLRTTLPIQQILQVFHHKHHDSPPKSIQSINVWIGDGDVVTPLHYDGLDNILFQLAGTKTLLLLPPSCMDDLGYERRMEEEWSYYVSSEVETMTVDADRGSGAAATKPQGHSPPPIRWSRVKTDRYVENHASFNPFTSITTRTTTNSGVIGSNSGSNAVKTEGEITTRTAAEHDRDNLTMEKMVQRWVDLGARFVTLEPGQGLFLPEFWSHAVLSTVGRDDRRRGDDNCTSSSTESSINGNRCNRLMHDTISSSHRHGINYDNEYDINLAINVWFKRP